jgi:hypothetical protein
LPLTLYKDLAEKYGFLMIGSNDSKNGLPGEDINGIVRTLMHEVRTLYPIDTNRIYLLGFSGGARVAATAAMYDVSVKGVFGCGAGLGSVTEPILYKFDYFGCVGTADFNMTEMLQLDEPLTRAGFRHFITTFPGNHAWPPADVLEDGFMWATLNAMKDGLIKKDEAYISAVMTFFEYRISFFISNNQLLAAAEANRERIAFMEGLLVSIAELKEMLVSLEKDPEYQSQHAFRVSVMKQEEAEKQEMMQALQSKDLAWWKEWITRHASPVTRHESLNPEDTLKDRRLMAFLSLFCYMNANAAIARQNEEAAVKIIAIYEMADPKNPEPNYMRALLFARRSENEAVFSQLSIAVTKGFTDKPRLIGQAEFLPLNSSPEWADLLKTMK